MSLEKKQVIGEMTVGQLCDISVRTDTVIIDNGEEVSRSFHRHVVAHREMMSAKKLNQCSQQQTHFGLLKLLLLGKLHNQNQNQSRNQ
jgi:hypothetical protein